MAYKANYDWKSYVNPDEERTLEYQDEVFRDLTKERDRIRKRCNARHAKAAKEQSS